MPPHAELTDTAGPSSVQVEVRNQDVDSDTQKAWQRIVDRIAPTSTGYDPRWLAALCRGLRHKPYLLLARQKNRLTGVLPLALVQSRLFGRFLVSLPYINSAGVVAENKEAEVALIDRAVRLADELDVRHLELRHEQAIEHPALGTQLTSKVHMRLALPDDANSLWKQFKPKVRNQIRKGEKHEFTVYWGHDELLADFYAVFSRNMRDLGTPVFGRWLFRSLMEQFPERTEFCVLRSGKQPIAAALLVHGNGITEVPSASSLRELNATNANMLMYWQLLQRAIEQKQAVFDFGRSSLDSNTLRFKKQWGALPEPAVWQYYVRQGDVGDMRRENGKYDRMINIWRRLPVGLTRILGPAIIRGIP
ncbi:MAG TPA: FemAB family XrtA/PEP-CTERM system-associated protein [Thermoguttaceae bacterium]|nr:FemAB family XrtA/PEP-CTERM system-associated protein [Thermoguttaceae bacterium]